jgi:hypothetical protein
MPDKYIYGVVGIGALLAVFVALWFGAMQLTDPQQHTEVPPISNTKNETSNACTMEARICPDGSSVGRTGPNCEFAACPTDSPASAIVKTTVGQKVNALNVTLTPLEVTDDSRCPVGVQCIWAGTVKVKTKVESGLGSTEVEIQLNTPVTTEAETITLTEVTPNPKAQEKIELADYQFTFEITRR